MKKLFITLSFFFVAAYANNSMSGYTESIVENASTSNSNKPQFLWPFSDPVYDLPHNPYTGEILEDFKWSSVIPTFEKNENHLYGFDQIPDECYTAPYTLAFCYNEIKVACNKKDDDDYCDEIRKTCQEYKHCYEPLPKKCYSYKKECNDKENIECDKKESIECDNLAQNSEAPIAYISVEKGKDVVFNYKLPNEMYDNYCLIREDFVKDINGNYKMVKNEKKIKKDLKYAKPIDIKKSSHTIKKEYLQTEGIFKIYANSGTNAKNEQICKKPGENEDYFFAIKIIPYEPTTKNIVYIEVNGDKKDPWNSTNGGFSISDVKEYFNDKVYNQAVVNGDFFNDPDTYNYEISETTISTNPGISQKKSLEVDHLIEINMTDPSNLEQDKIMTRATEALRQYAYLKNNKIWNLDSKYWHIVYAINKERKFWEIKKCFDGSKDKSDLSQCPNFDPENDDPNATYYLYLRDKNECKEPKVRIDKTKAKLITIKTSPKKDGNGNVIMEKGGNIRRHFYVNEKEDLTDCHILFTDDAYPVIPSTDGVSDIGGRAQAIHYPFDDNYYTYIGDNFPYDNYLAYGGVVFAPRGAGKSHLPLLMHELGHSFGLTDVTKTTIFNRTDILETKDQYFDDINKNKAIYINQYGSAETNLMSWQDPPGKRLKHRSTPIVCPGGASIYLAEKNPKKFLLNTELKLSVIGEDKWDLSEIGDNQWDCIRDCHKDNFNTKNRETYFNRTGYCDPEGTSVNIIITNEEVPTLHELYNEYENKITKPYPNQYIVKPNSSK